jgi:hypothetical protein
MPGVIRVLDPTGVPRQVSENSAPRLRDLRGRTVGFVWNNKPNGDLLFEHLARMLREKYEVRMADWVKKPRASVGAQPQEVEALARQVDAVVVGIGD